MEEQKSSVDSERLVKEIYQSLSEIKNWNVNTFDFEIPVSPLNKTDVPTIDVNDLTPKPNFDECDTLSKDSNGNKIKLNGQQLAQLRKTGKFDVQSVRFTGQKHTWQVSKILQSGTQNIVESFMNGVALFCKCYVIYIPDTVYKRKYVSMYDSVCSLARGLLGIPVLLFGSVNNKKMYSNSEIKNKTDEFVVEKIIDSIFNGNSALRKITVDIGNGTYLNINLVDYRDVIKIIMPHYKELKTNWDRTAVSRRNDLLTKFMDTGSKEEVLKKVVNEEVLMKQKEIYDLVNRLLKPDDATLITNIMNGITVIRNHTIAYENEKNRAMDLYRRSQSMNYGILSRIPEWTEQKEKEYKKEWTKNNPFEKRFGGILTKLEAQEKFIFGKNLEVMNSVEFKNMEASLEKKTNAKRKFEFDFRIWNHNNWKINKVNERYTIEKYNTVKNSTTYPGWRITNVALRMAWLFWNGWYFLLRNMIMDIFGIRSLYGIKDYSFDWGIDQNGSRREKTYGTLESAVDETTCLLKPTRKNKTWFGRLNSLWTNISDSRNEFLAREDNSILGKNFTNVFNIIWNYIIKGIFGTVIIFVFFPVLVLINFVFSFIALVTSPIWVLLSGIAFILCTIFVYDFDNPHASRCSVFPLFRLILYEIVIRGFCQFFLTVLIVLFFITASFVVITGVIVGTITKYLYDLLVYHLILRYRARIPSADGNDRSLVRRISGPGLGTHYFYLVGYDLALVLLHKWLEECEMYAYVNQMKNKIGIPLDNLHNFYRAFGRVGLLVDRESELIKTFTATKRVLEKKLDEIENDYWKNNSIQGSLQNKDLIKMTKNDLTLSLEMGGEICKKYVTERIFPRLSEESRLNYWSNKKLEENDWKGLALDAYIHVFNRWIMEPIEETDGNGFHLVVKETKSRQFLVKLFNGEPNESLEVEIYPSRDKPSSGHTRTSVYKPIINENELPLPDISLVTPDNLFSGKYENMITIKQEYLENRNHDHISLNIV